MIVVIGHIKGGTGKTTTAFQLAMHRRLTKPDRKVWLIDADEQQSALDTVSIRSDSGLTPALSCSSYTKGRQLSSQLNAQFENWDDIIIDCGGRDSDALRVALLACNKLIVPCLPRAYDIWALSRLETLIESARNLGAEFDAYAFINRRDKSADCRETIDILDKSEVFTLMKSSFSARMSYAKAGGQGKALSEMKPADKKALSELEAFSKEIFED